MNDDELKTLDPHARQLLALARKAGYPPLHALTPAKARAAYAASWESMQSPGGAVDSVQDITIDGPGGALKLRVYRGKGVTPSSVVPCMLYLHGGGWVIGNLESHDRMCRRLANVANLCVVAVDYRLAPEHPFPAALDDCAAALKWVFDHAAELCVDANALGVGGDSAGGNLAASLALLERDGLLPTLAYQALIYPALDMTTTSASYQFVVADLPLSAQTMHYFIGHYLPNAEDRLDWRASPLLAHSLAGVASALVMTVAHDPLCDEGRAYAQRLDADGVRVTALHFNDHMHGLLGQGRMVPAADVIGDFVFRTVGHELYRAAARYADSP